MTIAPGQTRIDVIDALRGLAVLGILRVNLPGHALPFFALFDPYIAGGTDRWNLSQWVMTEIFVEGAMRGLFSLLFGASMVLFFGVSAMVDGDRSRVFLFVRRNLWLILFGLIHGFLLLMPGDILYTYGICAFGLLAVRRLSARHLFMLGGFCLAVLASGVAADAVSNASVKAAAMAPGADQVSIEKWQDLQRPAPEMLEELRSVALGGYSGLMAVYGADYAGTIFSLDFFWYLLDAFTLMLFGVALMKTGFLTGALPARTYFQIGGALAVVSLIARCFTTADAFATDFIPLHLYTASLRELARIGLTIGYASLFIGLWKGGAFGILRPAFLATGRMAFTNYISGTLIATFIFYGYGLGLYWRFNRLELMLIIVAVWLFQIAFSIFWLRRYKLGPLEWGWRSLVQLRVLPNARQAS